MWQGQRRDLGGFYCVVLEVTPQGQGSNTVGMLSPPQWRCLMKWLTWIMSSKPLVVIFIEETLPPNFRIPPQPNVGACRKLHIIRAVKVSLYTRGLTVHRTLWSHLHPLPQVTGGHGR